MWNKINNLLNKKQMTIYELAKKSGITASTIYNMKYGNIIDPKFGLMEKIADVLDVSLDEFRSKN